MSKKTVQIAVRVDPELSELLDKLATDMGASTGMFFSRADIVRAALIKGIKSLRAGLK